MRDIDLIVIHCSDSTSGNADIIDSWHRERGWDCIGYHYVICRNGKVEEGRELERIGAHVKGKNRNSIGICIIGRLLFSHDERMTKAQYSSLFNLLFRLNEMYPKAKIRGHYELARGQKTCPNLCMTNLRETYSDMKARGGICASSR